MRFILEGAGAFIYPLAFCSFLALFIIIERLISLRDSKVIPRAVVDALVEGRIDALTPDLNTTAGRIIWFFKNSSPDAEALKAFVQLEITRLERGMFWLDIVISAAPLLGLLGTVAGLVTVFAGPEDSLPSPEAISRGVGLALSTTVIGLSIAIPSIVGNSYINRRIEKLCARLNIGVERLIDLSRRR
ncbi:MAG: MotA/TolQ/ExbB proton channel family protein [Verrucomicrobia bacterium]|nr:MAG: MotA/TolQ/ExbB proton channel family protein [Verrucomicrobiota bacterium]